MKKNGAEVIHLATCMLVGYPPCEHLETFRRFIPAKYGLEVVGGVPSHPQNYYLTHTQLGTWDGKAWQERIKDALPDEGHAPGLRLRIGSATAAYGRAGLAVTRPPPPRRASPA